MRRIRVLIADDHAVVRTGLRMLIASQPDMECVAEAASGPEAVQRTRATPLDVVVLDFAMPGMNGIDAIRRLREASPPSRIIVLTTHDDTAHARMALAAGAAGYLTKHADASELLTAIRAVHRGRMYVLFTKTLDAAAEPIAVGGTTAPVSGSVLSPRERQVLALLAHGHTNREAAEQLPVSVKTVETYRARLGEKLGLRTRAEIVRLAMHLGLLTPETDPGSERP